MRAERVGHALAQAAIAIAAEIAHRQSLALRQREAGIELPGVAALTNK